MSFHSKGENPIVWYLRCIADARTVDDVFAVPKLLYMDLREQLAEAFVDRTEFGRAVAGEITRQAEASRGSAPVGIPGPLHAWFFTFLDTEFGRTVTSVVMARWHLKRARDSGAAVYCVWHACASEQCPYDAHPKVRDPALVEELRKLTAGAAPALCGVCAEVKPVCCNNFISPVERKCIECCDCVETRKMNASKPRGSAGE